MSLKRLFPQPSSLPSHIMQLLSSAVFFVLFFFLHKAYVLGQLVEKTEPIYCSLNLLSI